jgi:hypothetical protein
LWLDILKDWIQEVRVSLPITSTKTVKINTCL